MKLFSLLFAFFLNLILYTLHSTPAHAITNPLSVPNNKYGIHIISSSRDEADEASKLVNANGDWGYITVLAESKDRNHDKWQEFFNELRRRHLIPIVRLATKPDGNTGTWERPYEGEEVAWADFLDKLNWPVKNRYLVLYNEPNHGTEWGGQADPAGFAVTLNRTINALKKKSEDFFILNPGFDASAPNKAPDYMDEEEFMKKMDESVPGIFSKLDGWASHSYPNPGFIGKPTDNGRKSIRGWEWELSLLNQFGVKKVLPVFITETGWKHSDGTQVRAGFPDPITVGEYYKQSFETAWSNNRIVAVTPFVLSYQDSPFDQFSFKKITKNLVPGDPQAYHSAFYVLQDAKKIKGTPTQEEKARFVKLGIEKDGFTNYFEATASGTQVSFAYDEPYKLVLTFKNTGQSIWGDGNITALNLFGGGGALDKTHFELEEGKKIEPNGETTFEIPLRPLKGGIYQMSFNIHTDNKPLLEEDYSFEIEVKAPVFLAISASLKWKENFEGEYLLGVLGQLRYALSSHASKVILNHEGKSENLETKYLLPDQEYTFTLEKPYYKPKSINQKITPGNNNLEFGELQPDIRGTLFKPFELWKLLPWSN